MHRKRRAIAPVTRAETHAVERMAYMQGMRCGEFIDDQLGFEGIERLPPWVLLDVAGGCIRCRVLKTCERGCQRTRLLGGGATACWECTVRASTGCGEAAHAAFRDVNCDKGWCTICGALLDDPSTLGSQPGISSIRGDGIAVDPEDELLVPGSIGDGKFPSPREFSEGGPLEAMIHGDDQDGPDDVALDSGYRIVMWLPNERYRALAFVAAYHFITVETLIRRQLGVDKLRKLHEWTWWDLSQGCISCNNGMRECPRCGRRAWLGGGAEMCFECDVDFPEPCQPDVHRAFGQVNASAETDLGLRRCGICNSTLEFPNASPKTAPSDPTAGGRWKIGSSASRAGNGRSTSYGSNVSSAPPRLRLPDAATPNDFGRDLGASDPRGSAETARDEVPTRPPERFTVRFTPFAFRALERALSDPVRPDDGAVRRVILARLDAESYSVFGVERSHLVALVNALEREARAVDSAGSTFPGGLLDATAFVQDLEAAIAAIDRALRRPDGA